MDERNDGGVLCCADAGLGVGRGERGGEGVVLSGVWGTLRYAT
jgi:hypothetical protein